MDEYGQALRILSGRRPLRRQQAGPFFIEIVVGVYKLRIVFKICENYSVEWNFAFYRPHVGWVRSNVYRSEMTYTSQNNNN